MARVMIVIGCALAFAILGLVAGHLCVAAYSGEVAIDAAGHVIRAQGGREPRTELLVGCYLAPPVFGALLGFGVSIVAIKAFATDDRGRPGSLS